MLFFEVVGPPVAYAEVNFTYQFTIDDLQANSEVKPQWHWPEWLKAKYIAMDRCGTWHAFASDELFANTNTGRWQSGSFSMPLPEYMVAFEPPHNERDRWQHSLISNPMIRS